MLSDSPARAQRLEYKGLPWCNNSVPYWAAWASLELPLGSAGNGGLGQEQVVLHPGGGGLPRGQGGEAWGRGNHRWGPQGSSLDLISEWGWLPGSFSGRGFFQAGFTGSAHGNRVPLALSDKLGSEGFSH